MTETPNNLNYIPFESFEVGQKQNFGAYKVTEEEITEFAQKYLIFLDLSHRHPLA